MKTKQSDIQTTPQWLKQHFNHHFDPCPISPKTDGLKIDKSKVLSNCVTPKLGLHIFNCVFKDKQQTLGGVE